MRDVVAAVILSVALGFALGVIACVLAPDEWHSGLHKNAYWPFTVELGVRDR